LNCVKKYEMMMTMNGDYLQKSHKTALPLTKLLTLRGT